MSLKQTHEMEATPEECIRELSKALHQLDFEIKGRQIIAIDGDRKLIIDLVYEEDRHLGSLVLPMTQVNYEFFEYTQQEMDKLMEHIKIHMLRGGG